MRVFTIHGETQKCDSGIGPGVKHREQKDYSTKVTHTIQYTIDIYNIQVCIARFIFKRAYLINIK